LRDSSNSCPTITIEKEDIMFLTSIRELVQKKLKATDLDDDDKHLLEWYDSKLTTIDNLSEEVSSLLDRLRELIENDIKGLQNIKENFEETPAEIVEAIDNIAKGRAQTLNCPEEIYFEIHHKTKEEGIAFWDEQQKIFENAASLMGASKAFLLLMDLKTKSFYLDELFKLILEDIIPIGDKEAFLKMHLKEIQKNIEDWRTTIKDIQSAKDPVDVLKAAWKTGWKIAETLTISTVKALGGILMRFMTGERLTDEERIGLQRLQPDIEKSLDSLEKSNNGIILTIKLWQNEKK